MKYQNIQGVPNFYCEEISNKRAKYCLLIPVINEGVRIKKELERSLKFGIHELVDIIICDGGSTDGSMKLELLRDLGVNTLLVKDDLGKQGAQLRMGFWWALQRGYNGMLTIDGNNKDSIESIPLFIEKLEQGYDFIQGSRYIKGGKAINTPLIRHISVNLIHAPIISLAARHRFTDTTNAFRAYSIRYINHEKLLPFRDIFVSYELLAYLSVRATQLGLKVCEVPVTRAYPKGEKTPTKISPIKGNMGLMKTLMNTLFGKFNPK